MLPANNRLHRLLGKAVQFGTVSLDEVTWEMGTMSRIQRTPQKAQESTRSKKSRRYSWKSIKLPPDDKRVQYDFGQGDVCLNITKQYPPDMPKNPDIPEGLTYYILRHHDGTLCMIADSYRHVYEHCKKHKLTYHNLQ